ncbi:hypothetical protein LTR37_011558 [Vermiconidia calcicola]|uniref:Uncharacterized protein n=1 Tax=Vermiconidia calcicola TaxID=1690605 RepID=A0ACC3N1I5_9PEZI|nr:hypothetical protein LTR37_011558 [Vermiconidia calcicola]
MKSLSVLSLAIVAVSAYTPRDYGSGFVHQKIMGMKHDIWARDRAAGLHAPDRYPSLHNQRDGARQRSDSVKCRNGQAVVEPGNANQTFRCKNMDLYDFKSHADLGSSEGEGSSSWGWTSADGRQFGAIGQADGTAFVEIDYKTGNLAYLGRLPQQSVPSIWREIRVYNDICIIGSEAEGHGVQLFDMKKLLDLDPSSPVTFSTETDVLGVFRGLPIGRTHNIVVNWDLGYAVAVGAQPRNSTCLSGLIYIDLSDPSNPTSPGCASDDGYTHDAQCVKYNGPDTRYTGRDICMAYNEDSLTIVDATDKSGKNASTFLGKLYYPGASYTHQGWFINDNHDFLLIDDELDEIEANGTAASGIPVTHIVDASDLHNPKYTGYFNATDSKAIDHNQYIVDGLAYQSNYGSGLWVHDVTSIPSDPTGNSVETVAFFDIYPEDDAAEGGGLVEFVGTWSHFLLPSGHVVINTIERGVFVVKIAHGKGSGPGPGYPQ